MKFPSVPTRVALLLLLASLLPIRAAEAGPMPNPLAGTVVTELARSEVQEGGRTLTYIRIRPPALVARPASPPAATVEPTPEQLEIEARREAKTHVSLTLTAITYAGTPTVTELSWTQEDGRRFRAFSNVNFELLSQLAELETETRVYSWFPFISEGDPAELPVAVRTALAAAESPAEYLFEGTEAEARSNEATLQGLDFLHAYAHLHRERLAAEHAERMKLNAEQARQAALNPPRPRDETIYFWKLPASALKAAP